MGNKVSNVSKIVVPATEIAVQQREVSKLVGKGIGKFPPQQWAPAWFYSALNWLGKTYFDANNVEQQFNQYLAGSDVDPYAQIGSTRLFLIVRTGEGYRLSVAPDADSTALALEGEVYPNTDG